MRINRLSVFTGIDCSTVVVHLPSLIQLLPILNPLQGSQQHMQLMKSSPADSDSLLFLPVKAEDDSMAPCPTDTQTGSDLQMLGGLL